MRADGRPRRGLGPLNTAERAVSNAQYVRRNRPVPLLVVSFTNPVTATAPPAAVVVVVALVSALISAVTSSTVPVLIPEEELDGVVDTRR